MCMPEISFLTVTCYLLRVKTDLRPIIAVTAGNLSTNVTIQHPQLLDASVPCLLFLWFLRKGLLEIYILRSFWFSNKSSTCSICCIQSYISLVCHWAKRFQISIKFFMILKCLIQKCFVPLIWFMTSQTSSDNFLFYGSLITSICKILTFGCTLILRSQFTS